MSDGRPAVAHRFAGDGEMAARIADHDWSSTPLGATGCWSDALVTAVNIILRSRYPMSLCWGDDLVMLYNDAHIPALGAKHPQALGVPLRESFAEIWPTIGPMQRAVLAGGPATWDEDLPLVIERGDGPEQTYFTFSYSHVPDPSGTGGVLAVLTDKTSEVVSRRRLGLLNDISRATAALDDVDTVAITAMQRVATVGDEIAFAATYLRDGDGLRLAATVGAPGEGQPRLPTTLAPGDEDPYGLFEVEDGARRTVPLPAAPGDGRARLAAVHPLRDGLGSGRHDVLLLAPDPLRLHDTAADEWCGLLGDQVSASLAAARALRREQERIAAMAELQRTRTEFLAGISHEFRTPLTLLLGPLGDALKEGGRELGRLDLEIMHRNAERLLRLVDSLLDLARGEAGRLEAATTAVDVAALTQDLTRAFARAFDRVGRILRVDLDDVGVLAIDPTLWERAVLNLVSNAFKHAADGDVAVSLTRDRDEVVLTVADTGPGIPAEHRERVFGRFERVRTDGVRPVEGAGIGLALVAEAAALHGGRADVVDTPGGGATFRLRVPVRLVESDDPVSSAGDTATREARLDAEPVAVPVEATPGGDTDRPSVLVVEDDDDLRRRIARTLADRFRVREARDGQEALELVARDAPDLVLTDVMMPRLDGHGLVAALRADPSTGTIPIIVLTARTGPEAATASLMAGADDHLTKPFDTAELVARTRTTLELATTRQETAAARSRAALLAGIARELQSHLTVVLGAVDLLGSTRLDESRRDALLARARQRGAELRRLVHELVDWSLLAADRHLGLRLEMVPIADALADAHAEHADVVVRGASSIAVTTDRERLVRCVEALVADARNRGARRIEVRVDEQPTQHVLPAASTAPHVAVIVVSDDGSPLSPEADGAAFATVEDAGPGPGRRVALGRHVAAATVAALGGHLDRPACATSGHHDLGTALRITLPLVAPT